MKNKGITLITLVVAVLIMLILSGTLVYTIGDRFKVHQVQARNADIKVLQNKVAQYYAKYQSLPIKEKYEYTTDFLKDKNINDNDNYYVIDIEKLDGLSLNLGKGFSIIKQGGLSDDVYLINEKTHTIYYAKGVESGGKISYRIEVDYTILKENNRANEPILLEGMTPVKWDTNEQKWVETTSYDGDWYEYTKVSGTNRWANAKTQDGSMWVWIPRFAYQITTGYHGEGLNYENEVTKQAGNIEIKFLKGTTNEPFDGSNITIINETGKNNWNVHPAFQDGSNSNFENGEWDQEISGFWVAKFEAGYETKQAQAVDSIIKYTSIDGITQQGYLARTDSFYGSRTPNETNIKYPVFQEKLPSMNAISIGDAFALCKFLTAEENPYGLKETANSHLLKNSEWGAIAYLALSDYGINGKEVLTNYEDSNIDGFYAITGSGDMLNKVEKSTTYNIYGVYDLVGGLAELVAAYTNQENIDSQYGQSMVMVSDNKIRTKSDKYVTIYEADSEATQENYIRINNQKKYGDAIWETSQKGSFTTAWFGAKSEFVKTTSPYFLRGGYKTEGIKTGLFSYGNHTGVGNFQNGFRACLISN